MTTITGTLEPLQPVIVVFQLVAGYTWNWGFVTKGDFATFSVLCRHHFSQGATFFEKKKKKEIKI